MREPAPGLRPPAGVEIEPAEPLGARRVPLRPHRGLGLLGLAERDVAGEQALDRRGRPRLGQLGAQRRQPPRVALRLVALRLQLEQARELLRPEPAARLLQGRDAVVDVGAALDDRGVGGVQRVPIAERGMRLGDAPQVVDPRAGHLIGMGAGDVEQALPRLVLLERLQLGAHLVLAQELDQLLGHLPVRVLALEAADLGAHGGVVAGIVELPERPHVDACWAARTGRTGGCQPGCAACSRATSFSTLARSPRLAW